MILLILGVFLFSFVTEALRQQFFVVLMERGCVVSGMGDGMCYSLAMKRLWVCVLLVSITCRLR